MCHKCDEKKCKCQLHGAWACRFTFTSPPIPMNPPSGANIVFNEDGTYVCDVDVAHQRPFGNFTNGARATPITGIWKKTGKCKYTCVGTNTALSLQPNPADPTNPNCYVWLPFARIKEECIIEVHCDNTHTGVKTFTLYDYNDLTLTQRLLDPTTQEPVPSFIQNIEAARVLY